MGKRVKPEALFSLLKACAYLLAFYFSQILVGFILALFIGNANDFIMKNAMEITIISNVCAVFICIWLMRRFEGKDVCEGFDINLSLKKPLVVLDVCLARGVFAQYVTAYWINTATLPDSWVKQLEENTDMLTSGSISARIIALAIVAPLTEEIIFRACIQGTLSKSINRWIAIAIQAIVFGLAHGAMASIIVATLLGVLMGWLYSTYKSILPSMLFHLAYNLTSVFLSNLNIIFLIISCVCFALGLAFLVYLEFKHTNDKGDNNEAL
jgi:membrane protease YdiL (CAAX protease family)